MKLTSKTAVKNALRKARNHPRAQKHVRRVTVALDMDVIDALVDVIGGSTLTMHEAVARFQENGVWPNRRNGRAYILAMFGIRKDVFYRPRPKTQWRLIRVRRSFLRNWTPLQDRFGPAHEFLREMNLRLL